MIIRRAAAMLPVPAPGAQRGPLTGHFRMTWTEKKEGRKEKKTNKRDCDEEEKRGDVPSMTLLPSPSHVSALSLRSSCSSLHPSFPLSSLLASLLAGKAINKWRPMFDQKQIYLPDAPPAFPPVFPTRDNFQGTV